MKTVVATLLVSCLVAVAGARGAAFPVTVQVDATQPVGALPPIWRFFGADEPNYATQPDGEKLLLELGGLRPGEVYFRAHNLMTSGDGTPDFKWGSTNIYVESDGKTAERTGQPGRHGAQDGRPTGPPPGTSIGQPVYNFAIIDHIIDTYLARGIHPYLELGFMPEALTSAPPGVPYRRPWKPGAAYKGITAGWSYPPHDYGKWAELIYRWTRHNVERYGRAEVERWYFEVWNEANLDFYWVGTPEDFYRLHDYAIDAVRRALPTARVGGPDVAGSGGAFMDGFLQHVTHGTNYATGKVGTPTDFLSFHAKGQPAVVAEGAAGNTGHVRMGISNQLKTVDETFAKIAAIPELAAKPIIIGENDPEGCAACPGPQNAYRNGTMYSCYTAATYARLWELARRRHVNLEGALTWAFTFAGQPWFAGYRQLATNGVDLPVLNVFRLLSRLGPEEVATTSSGELPLDEIVPNGVRGKPDVGVLATRTDKGRVGILLWHYQDDDVAGPDADIHITVSGLARGTRYEARFWRVDHDNGNAFTTWQAMGSPDKPDRQQVATLIRASQISARSLPLGTVGTDGSVKLQRQLPLQGVELIEIAPNH